MKNTALNALSAGPPTLVLRAMGAGADTGPARAQTPARTVDPLVAPGPGPVQWPQPWPGTEVRLDALFDAAVSDSLLSCASDDDIGGCGDFPDVGVAPSPISVGLPSPPMSPLSSKISPPPSPPWRPGKCLMESIREAEEGIAARRAAKAQMEAQSRAQPGPGAGAEAEAEAEAMITDEAGIRDVEARVAAYRKSISALDRWFQLSWAILALLIIVLALKVARPPLVPRGAPWVASPGGGPTVPTAAPSRTRTTGEKTPPVGAAPARKGDGAVKVDQGLSPVAKAIRHVQQAWARLRRPRQRQQAAAAMLADQAVREALAESGQCGAVAGQRRSVLAAVRHWASDKCWVKQEGAGCEW